MSCVSTQFNIAYLNLCYGEGKLFEGYVQPMPMPQRFI